MLSEKLIVELGIVIQAQNHLLKKLQTAASEIEEALSEVENKLSFVDSNSKEIRELESLMNELEACQEWIEEEDFGDFSPDQIWKLYEKRQQSVFQDLKNIGFKNWDSFVRECQAYTLSQGGDPLAPYEAFLTEEDLKTLQAESHGSQYKWDKWDYMFVGASGILACITDYLLVKIPVSLTSGEYAGQLGSPVTQWLKKYDTTKSNDWFAQFAEHLSKECKVPYDSMSIDNNGRERIAGMFPKSHRFQSLGHDPVLGFVFGVLDIMRGTISGFSYESLTQSHSWIHGSINATTDPVNLIEAILRQIGHLISDVSTPMGLPAPFLTLVQGLNLGSFGEKQRTAGEVARWMYLNGYDFRHFLVSGITPAVIEIFLRAYIMLRHYSEYGQVKCNLASHPKYRAMLLAAHGIATLGNVGKITLLQGNPLAFNYAEWLAFIRYLGPSMKYWIFDQHHFRIKQLESINDKGWNQLLQNSDQLLTTVTELNSQQFCLGSV